MTTERENPFYDLGYTTPEDAIEMRAAHSHEHPPIQRVTPRKSGHVRDYESDADYRVEMESLPPGFVEENPSQPMIPGLALAIARLRLEENDKAAIEKQYGQGTLIANALMRSRKERRRFHQ